MPFLAAAWPLLRWVAPALPAKATLYLIAALGLLASHGAVAGYVWVQGYKARVEAVASAKADFRETLAKEKEAHDNRVAAAIAAAEAEPATSPDRAERVRQCAASPSCRDRSRQ